MKASDFVLIQVNKNDEFYELGRLRPYKDGGFYCDGFAQNNGRFYEFSLHIGKENDIIPYKLINIGYPVRKYNGQKVRVKAEINPMDYVNLQHNIY